VASDFREAVPIWDELKSKRLPLMNADERGSERQNLTTDYTDLHRSKKFQQDQKDGAPAVS